MRIPDSVALVTGGASGLGEATVRMVLAGGGRAMILDRPGSAGERLAGELGASAAFVPADVTREGEVERAVAATVEGFGALHVAVNCAGIGAAMKTFGKQGPMPLALFAKVVEVNLVGTFNVIRLAAAAMARNAPNDEGERGVLVNTASAAAFDGQIGQAAYSASKGGVVGMTLPIARDLAKLGMRCVTIAPGLFNTPLLAALPEEAKASLGAQVSAAIISANTLPGTEIPLERGFTIAFTLSAVGALLAFLPTLLLSRRGPARQPVPEPAR